MSCERTDLTSAVGVRALMDRSRSVEEWNRNCRRVAEANAHRPEGSRHERLLIGPLYRRASAAWGG